MSTAKQQWLVFSAEQHSFAVNTDDILQIIPVAQIKLTEPTMPGVIGWTSIEGESIPVIDLVEHVHHKNPKYEHHEIIVTRGKEQLIGLMAERVLAVTQQDQEAQLDHCVREISLIEDVHYLKTNTLAVMRQS